MKKKLIAVIFISMMVILPCSVVEVMAQVTSETRVTPVEAFTLRGNALTDYDPVVGGLDVVIPSDIDGVPITSIGKSAFYQTNIKSVVIPDSVKVIGDQAFFKIESLTQVDFGKGVETIGKSAFEQTGLEIILIPNSVKVIGEAAFKFIKNLVQLEIGENVETIGSYAFAFNDLEIETLIIPESLKTIGSSVFPSTKIQKLVIPGTLETIPDYAFWGTEVTKLELGEGIKTIGLASFGTNEGVGIEKIVIPDSVVEIKDRAFEYYNVDNIDLGEGVQKIGDKAFGGSSTEWTNEKLNTLNVPSSVSEVNGSRAFLYNNIAYVNLSPTSPLKMYGTSRIKGKDVTIDENRRFNIKDLYPDIDTNSVKIKSMSNTGYTYDKSTGEIQVNSINSFYTLDHTITKDGVDILNVVTKFNTNLTYKAIFRENDGTILKEETIVKNYADSAYATPPDSPEGYHYTWTPNPVDRLTFGTTVFTTDTIANDYILEYDANSGIGRMSKQNFKYNVRQNLKDNNFTKEGYTFKSWNTKADGSGVSYNNLENVSNLAISGTTKLYAKWEANTNTKYTVKHMQQNIEDDNYTLFETENLTGTTDTVVSATKKNYVGFTPETGTISGTIALDGSLFLEVKYDRNKFDVNFDSNGAQANPETLIGVKYETPITEPSDVIKPGYTLSGWFTEETLENEWNFSTSKVTSDMTLYAKWEANTNTKYTVKHMKQNIEDGNYLLFETEKLTGTTDTVVSAIKKNYVGFTPETGTISGTIAPDGSLVLEVKYDRNKFDVNFDSNGAQANPETLTGVKYEAPITEPSNVIKPGYTLNGWFTEETLKNEWNFSTSNVTSNMTLYAKWEANTYNVKFDANSGVGTMINQEFTFGKAQNLTLNTFIKDNFTFTGWNIAPDGNGTNFTDGEVVENLATSGTVTLYAQWDLTSIELEPSVPTTPQVPLDPSIDVIKPTKHVVEEKLEDTGVTTNILIYIALIVASSSLYALRKRN